MLFVEVLGALPAKCAIILLAFIGPVLAPLLFLPAAPCFAKRLRETRLGPIWAQASLPIPFVLKLSNKIRLNLVSYEIDSDLTPNFIGCKTNNATATKQPSEKSLPLHKWAFEFKNVLFENDCS